MTTLMVAACGVLFNTLACEPNEPSKAHKTNVLPQPEPNKPAKASPAQSVEDLRAGKNYITTKVYSAQEDEEILKLYQGLRVADVVDGMDKVGLKNIGSMSPEIHPLWKDTEHYTHRIQGIAVTVRYVPTNKPQAPEMDAKPYDAWRDNWYTNLSPEPFIPLIRKGTVLVIEEPGDGDTGSIGSNNIMVWKLAGCIGVVTSNTSRDTDEIITEKMPLYLKKVGRGIRPGRNEIESVNRPVVCGGALVEPGDVIVADGEGVVVVPRAKARDVAEYARVILEKDKAARQGIYKQLGMPMDDSVK
ncbi:MAG: RraA family protein [Sedimentisphaerales bacterium]